MNRLRSPINTKCPCGAFIIAPEGATTFNPFDLPDTNGERGLWFKVTPAKCGECGHTKYFTLTVDYVKKDGEFVSKHIYVQGEWGYEPTGYIELKK